MNLYDDVDIRDEETSVLVRFAAALAQADEWITSAIWVLDEEGEPHPAASAALEAARAALVAALRAELLDPWWEDHDIDPSEIVTGETPRELVERILSAELEKAKGSE
jgi:hypothetical protein